MPEEEGLPREVPIDVSVAEPLRDQYISVSMAAEITGVHSNTILRHLRIGSLAGIRVGGKAWLVQRVTAGEVPAIDMWMPGKPGNPAWKTKQND